MKRLSSEQRSLANRLVAAEQARTHGEALSNAQGIPNGPDSYRTTKAQKCTELLEQLIATGLTEEEIGLIIC